MFIKHGDGKILTVVLPEEVTEEQKKVAKDSKIKPVKPVKTDKVPETKDPV